MKKVIGIAVAIVLFLVLIIVVVLDGGNEDEVCAEDEGGSGSGDVVVDGDFAYPSDKEATQETSPYGPREGGMHLGQDIAGPRGTPIYAFADGRVIQAQDSGVQGFGGWVVVEHDIDGKQIQTVYGHEEPGQVKVKTGDKVTKGQHIADMGSAGQSSGPHLHFEVVEGDRAAGGERVDPKPWLEKAEEGKKGGGDSDKKDKDSKKSSDGGGKVLVVGDSISNGARSQIESAIPGAEVRAKDSKQYAAGMQEIDDGDQFDTVVMALGTNGEVGQDQFDAAKDKIGDANLVLMTIAGVPHADSFNKSVKKSGYDYFDWAAEANKDPGMLVDGVHPGPSGSKIFADTMAAAVGGGSKKSSDSGSKKSKSKGSGQPADEKGGFEGLSGRQLALAKQIVAIGESMHVDEKGRQIAVATAKHESQLQVYANDGVITPEEQSGMADDVTSEKLKKSLDFPHDAVSSDHGSVGTFQQQVGIWGDVEELMNPAVQAKNFYEHLEDVDYQGMEVGAAASTVQGNDTGTGVYQQEADIATKLVDKYRGAGKDLSEEEIEALGEANVGDGCDTEAGNGDSSDDPAPSGELGERIVAAARKEFGYPYVWGGGDENGPTKGQDGGEEGYDCSGLVLRAVAVATKGKVKLPHQTQAQAKDEHLKKVDWEDKKPGDIILIGGDGAEHHVAIYSGKKDGKDKWIEAQTYGVDSGEYDVRTDEPHQAYRVSE